MSALALFFPPDGMRAPTQVLLVGGKGKRGKRQWHNGKTLSLASQTWDDVGFVS